MKKLFLSLFIIMCFSTVVAQVESDFEKYKKEQEAAFNAMVKDDNSMLASMENEYQEYIRLEQEAYNRFVKEMSALWGGGNVIESSDKDWVEYSDNGMSRSRVDFEKGSVTIEIIVDDNEEKIEKKVEQKIKELLISRGKSKDYDTSKEKSVPLQETPVLENQVKTPSGEIVTENNVDECAKEIAEETDYKINEVEGDDGKQRQIVTIKLDLMPDHIKIRAEKYRNEVEKYCRKYDISPAMAYAVMQTESSFNPKAKSHVPAYGLMQIVPSSAGKDCAQSLNKPFSKPTANYLYEPENNIEMGIHYLYLLKKRYYADVKDADSQDLCIIASYNTGAGNVSRSLRGDTKISKAIPQINAMSYDELFGYFEKNLLPETQNYIRKVTENMNNFNKWIK